MIKVCVAGNFFPLHDKHVAHLERARKLGDYLIAIIGSDEYLRRKDKPIFLSLENRKKQLMAWVDEVVEVIDTDGTCAETLRMLKPNFFAKGGDKTPDTMPLKEIEVCKEIGCQIVYGVCDEEIYSSSKILKEMFGK
jgi:cytidyltransferase-like protein